MSDHVAAVNDESPVLVIKMAALSTTHEPLGSWAVKGEGTREGGVAADPLAKGSEQNPA